MSIVIPELGLDPGLETYVLNEPPQTLFVDCIEDSLTYGYWNIQDFKYQSGGDSGETLAETIYFRITSELGKLDIECQAPSNWTATDPEASAYCDSAIPATTFKFHIADENYGTLKINQIWSCPSGEEGTQ